MPPTRRRRRFARKTARWPQLKKISACLNSVASVNPAVLIDRAERGLRKMVKDETHDRLTSTVSLELAQIKKLGKCLAVVRL